MNPNAVPRPRGGYTRDKIARPVTIRNDVPQAVTTRRPRKTPYVGATTNNAQETATTTAPSRYDRLYPSRSDNRAAGIRKITFARIKIVDN